MFRHIRSGLLQAVFCATAMACAVACTTGVTALTPHEQEAVAITTADGYAKAADKALQAGKINTDEAQSVHDQAKAVVGLVTAARKLPTGSTGAVADLQQAATLLQAVLDYLTTKGVQTP